MKLVNKTLMREMIGIFNFVIFYSYSWSFFIFFYEMPSFILHFSADEIAGFISYQLMLGLFESIIITAILTIILYFFPIRGIKNNLITAGGLIVTSLAISAIIIIEIQNLVSWLQSTFSVDESIGFQIVFGTWAAFFFSLPIISVIVARNEKVIMFMEKFSDDLSVLAVLYTVLGVVGAIIVVLRNLF